MSLVVGEVLCGLVASAVRCWRFYGGRIFFPLLCSTSVVSIDSTKLSGSLRTSLGGRCQLRFEI